MAQIGLQIGLQIIYMTENSMYLFISLIRSMRKLIVDYHKDLF